MTGRLLLDRAPWWIWAMPEAPELSVRVRFEVDAQGRHRISELRLAGYITNDALRLVHAGRIEAAADIALGSWDAPAAPGTAMLSTEPPALTDEEWSIPEVAVVRDLRDAVRADGRGRSDEFYRRIAESYRSLLVSTHRPAAAIADANDIPVTTAHRWIREARRRGFLPPGRQGRAG